MIEIRSAEMTEDEPQVYIRENGETLQDYLQRYSPEECQRIYRSTSARTRFAEVMLNFRSRYEVQGNEEYHEFNRLWNVLRHLNSRKRLLHLINMLEPTRLQLLQSLENYADDLCATSKWCSIFRILCCTADTVSTVGGLLLRELQSCKANLAFHGGYIFGLLGFSSALTELKIFKSTTHVLKRQIHADQKLFDHIRMLYHETGELENALLDIFPFDMTPWFMEELNKTIEDGFNEGNLLLLLLSAAEVTEKNSLPSKSRIRNLLHLMSKKEIRELFQWIVIHHKYFFLSDVARTFLPVSNYSPLMFVFQAIPSLAPYEKSMFIWPAFIRIAVNTWSTTHCIASLKGSEMQNAVDEMRNLKLHLSSELEALKKIADLIHSRERISDLLKISDCAKSSSTFF